MTDKRISDLTPKGSNISATDLFEVSVSNGSGGYNTFSMTGAEIGSGGAGVIDIIDGDTGSVTGATVTIYAHQSALGCGSSVGFSGATTFLTMNLTDSGSNTILGKLSGNATLNGASNSGLGAGAFTAATSGAQNSWNGYACLTSLTSGSNNFAGGYSSGIAISTGSFNTLLGSFAGSGLTGASSSNINIGYNVSITGAESNTIRIGATGSGFGQQNRCFIAGIHTTNVGSVTTVVTEASNQLGTAVLTAGTGITIVPTANTITINSTGTTSTFLGDTGSATGSIITIFANNVTQNAGSSVSINASGSTLLFNVTDVNSNTIIGSTSGNAVLSGTDNIGLGKGVLKNLTSGSFNLAVGDTALSSATSASNNIALGHGSLLGTTLGSNNIGLGVNAGQTLSTGNNNLIIGPQTAGSAYTTESNNICLYNAGIAADANTIRIGTQGNGSFQQNKCFIAGIHTANVGSVATVVTEAGGQLGTAIITAGAGITVTPTANVITITSTSAAPTILGDTGSISGATLTVFANNTALNCGSTVNFSGSSTTLTMNVTTSAFNTIIGKSSGNATMTGTSNTGLGSFAFQAPTTGGFNAWVGMNALNGLTQGAYNAAFGFSAGWTSGQGITQGNYNTFLGAFSGSNLTGAASSNIYVGYGTGGSGNEVNTIRIGVNGSSAGQQNKCFIAGIDGVNVGSVATIVTESGSQLGTAVLTAGSGITITPGANTITISSNSSSGFVDAVNNTGTNLVNLQNIDIVSLTVSAGTWDISGVVRWTESSAITGSSLSAFFGDTPGNNTSAQDANRNTISTQDFPDNFSNIIVAMPTWRVTPVGTKTYYLKSQGNFSAGVIPTFGSIRATKVG